MVTIEIVALPADGDGPSGQLHSAELENIIRAANGCGVIASTISATVTGSDRNVTLPAFSYVAPDGAGGWKAVDYAGGAVAIATADADDPRIDLIVGAPDGISVRAGTPTEETGDVEEAPEGTLDDDEIIIAKVRVEAATANIGTDKVYGRAIDVSGQELASDTQLTSAQVKALAATNIELVASPGAGFAAYPVSTHWYLDHGGSNDFVQTNGTDALALKYAGGAEIAEVATEAQMTALLEASADAALTAPIATGLAPVADAAIDLDNNGAAEISGNAAADNTLSVRVKFRVVPMAAFGA